MSDGNFISTPAAELGPAAFGEAAAPLPHATSDRGSRGRRAIEALGRRAASPGDPERLMADAASLLAEALDLPFAGAAELSADESTLRIRLQPSREGPRGALSAPWETTAAANGSLAAYALTSARTVAVNDIGGEPRFDDRQLARRRVRAALAVPLLLEDRRFGVLLAADTSRRDLGDGEMLLAEAIGHVVAATLARWHAERRLEQERRLSRGVLETLDAAVLTLDAQWRILDANPACRRLTGQGDQQVTDLRFWDLFADAGQAEMLRKVLEEADREAASVRSEATLRTNDSNERQIAWSLRKIVPVEGAPCQFLATGIDVTEQRAAEQRARRAEVTAENARTAAAARPRGAEAGSEQVRPFGALPSPINVERRRKPRRSYPYIQRIAPILDGKRPDLDAFQEIQCNDISAGGFSFISDAPPVSDSYVVSLGCPPKFTFLTAQVAHVTRVRHEGERRFLVGCNYVGRVVY